MPRLAAAWLSVLASIQQVSRSANKFCLYDMQVAPHWCACVARIWQMGPAASRMACVVGPGPCSFPVWLSLLATLRLLLWSICCPCRRN